MRLIRMATIERPCKTTGRSTWISKNNKSNWDKTMLEQLQNRTLVTCTTELRSLASKNIRRCITSLPKTGITFTRGFSIEHKFQRPETDLFTTHLHRFLRQLLPNQKRLTAIITTSWISKTSRAPTRILMESTNDWKGVTTWISVILRRQSHVSWSKIA